MSENKRSSFSGSIGFVLAAAGSAVGLGNIWRFPYLAAKDGGGLFIIIYLILSVTFGFTLIITEVAVSYTHLDVYKRQNLLWGTCMNNNFNKEIYTKINELFYHDKKRLAHVLGVADLTFALAARYNVNLDDAYVAGLLHDCAKNYSWEELISISESNNIPITESEYRSPYLLHAKVGACLLYPSRCV